MAQQVGRLQQQAPRSFVWLQALSRHTVHQLHGMLHILRLHTRSGCPRLACVIRQVLHWMWVTQRPLLAHHMLSDSLAKE